MEVGNADFHGLLFLPAVGGSQNKIWDLDFPQGLVAMGGGLGVPLGFQLLLDAVSATVQCQLENSLSL